MVIGCPGSGKSTFSRALAGLTGIPLHHMDLMYWNSDGTKVEKSVFDARLEEAIRQEKWIIDGNYGASMEQRLAACDTVIFLDYPLEVCLEGVRARRGKERPDIPWTEKEEDKEFIGFIQSYRENSRPHVLERIGRYPGREVHIFTCRDEADEFLKEIGKTGNR